MKSTLWVIFVGNFLYLKITKAKILPFDLNQYWIYFYTVFILLHIFDQALY